MDNERVLLGDVGEWGLGIGVWAICICTGIWVGICYGENANVVCILGKYALLL